MGNIKLRILHKPDGINLGHNYTYSTSVTIYTVL
nr:MAG TPA: hypothetical protein [Caudoviricetes sp.]DAS90298.1 MAG TPA: hypothetical protein [Caudoviricetes sp.]